MGKDLKAKAEAASLNLGFSSLQEVIRVLLTKFSKKELSLRIEETEEKPSKYLLSAMKKAEKNLKKGNTSPVFDNVKDNLAWLKKQGI